MHFKNLKTEDFDRKAEKDIAIKKGIKELKSIDVFKWRKFI